MRLIATDVMELLKKKGASHICVVAGGIIPDEDKPLLEELGVTGNYGMGTPMTEIIDHINEQVNEMRVGVG
jgi:methylmalonyl-CoA mutase C-terminal domain/subunit